MPDPNAEYNFKLLPEAAFAGVTAIAILAFEILASLNIQDVLADPKTWGVAAVGAAARAFGAAALGFIARRATS